MTVRTILAALAIALAGLPASAKVYQGQEAAALRCAAILSIVPSGMARAGLVTQDDVRVFHLASVLILSRYVSGDERQKLRALQVVAERYSGPEHLRDFRTRSRTCLRQFPID